MQKKLTIHVDMDGVLADFDKFIIEKMGKKFAHDGNDKKMWEYLHGVPNFYFLLPPMSDMRQLWTAVLSYANVAQIEILTAIPRRTTMPTAEDDKRRWIAKHLGEDVIVNIGPYSRDKWKHAKPGDILIDDRKDNITDWISKANGVGILHKNAKDTIEILTAEMRNINVESTTWKKN